MFKNARREQFVLYVVHEQKYRPILIWFNNFSSEFL